MKFTVLTLFPEMFEAFQNSSVIKRAFQKKHVEVEVINIRDFSKNKHHHVDDSPYGGGAGMLLQIEPIDLALEHVKEENSYVVMTSPKAFPLQQKDMYRFSQKEHIIILCGHYEGFDERISSLVDENISVGDYILTGGELPSMIFMDSIIRLLKGSIREESLEVESYDNDLLEYPQYTKPRVYKGMAVPEILTSGDHQRIAHWRKKMALFETLRYRSDLLKKRNYSQEEKDLLKEIYDELKNQKARK